MGGVGIEVEKELDVSLAEPDQWDEKGLVVGGGGGEGARTALALASLPNHSTAPATSGIDDPSGRGGCNRLVLSPVQRDRRRRIGWK
jgi:hypothetical protein